MISREKLIKYGLMEECRIKGQKNYQATEFANKIRMQWPHYIRLIEDYISKGGELGLKEFQDAYLILKEYYEVRGDHILLCGLCGKDFTTTKTEESLFKELKEQYPTATIEDLVICCGDCYLTIQHSGYYPSVN